MALKLSIIIPAYNEAQRIAPTLRAVKSYAQSRGFEWECLIVLDGCTDSTRSVIRDYEYCSKFRILERFQNKGKGYSVREGMLAATGDIRLIMDADSSTTIEHFEKMLPYFSSGGEIVCCSRNYKDAPGAKYVEPQVFHKRLLGSLGNLFIQLTVLPGIWDTQCGFKAFTSQAAEAIFRRCKVDGWAWDIEVLVLARQYGFQTGWAPAEWKDHPGSNVRLQHYLNVLKDVFAIKARMKK
ncbi:MAG: dolichyl-phosphate beta-glucosyltransferase [Bacteroidota bacterium]